MYNDSEWSFENVIVLAWYAMRQQCLVKTFQQLEEQF